MAIDKSNRLPQFKREYAVFPMEHIQITQPAGVGTHIDQLAIDFAGKDAGIDGFYAPFKSRILKTYPSSLGNTILLGSCDSKGNPKRVRCADGVDRILTLMLTHSNTPQSWYEKHRINKTVFRQGDRVYGEGTAGFAFGNHVHMEVGVGWHYNIYLTGQDKYYGLTNPIRQDKVFHFLNGFNTFVNKYTENSFPIPKINVNGWGSSARKKEWVVLPADLKSCRVYKRNTPIKVGNEIGSLSPSKFHGLSYRVIERLGKNSVVINTKKYGAVKIFTGNQGIKVVSRKPKRKEYVRIPKKVKRVRVYDLDKRIKIGNEKGFLAPKKYEGLVYRVRRKPSKNVVIIKTKAFGEVKLFTGNQGIKVVKSHGRPKKI